MGARLLFVLWALLFPPALAAQVNIETLREFTEFTALWHKNISLNTDSFEFDEKNGILTCYYHDKKIFARGPAVRADKDFTLQGRWLRYYPNGRPMGEITFDANRRSGPAAGYYKNGARAIVCSYKGGSLEGRRVRYDNTGRLLDEAEYRGGVQTSLKIVTMISPSFQKPESIPLKSEYDAQQKVWINRDKKNMLIRTFTTGGVRLAEINVSGIGSANERYHGRGFFYHENGVLAEKGFFSSGKRDGEWQKFTDSGELESTTRYVSGEAVESVTQPTLP